MEDDKIEKSITIEVQPKNPDSFYLKNELNINDIYIHLAKEKFFSNTTLSIESTDFLPIKQIGLYNINLLSSDGTKEPCKVWVVRDKG